MIDTLDGSPTLPTTAMHDEVEDLQVDAVSDVIGVRECINKATIQRRNECARNPVLPTTIGWTGWSRTATKTGSGSPSDMRPTRDGVCPLARQSAEVACSSS